ncbi:hypothetical protein [Anaerosalibacter massiliensis]|uniref:Uncharacterized protein n=1 Tax=Anaerosalibacter massiliensis TaxID=1347392 RepID=A0A9X2S5I9_9FIRM|nr:hypothetical protein [Anaerosalibacter massiliensis]MCR2044640.1 hypothetical protein [Anaerosalibacter massiliensis]
MTDKKSMGLLDGLFSQGDDSMLIILFFIVIIFFSGSFGRDRY